MNAMLTPEDYIGYYTLDGAPCEIRATPEGGLEALIYVPGKGFRETDFWELVQKGRCISRTRFQELVMGEAKIRRARAVNKEEE
jgi:hypothetical protein